MQQGLPDSEVDRVPDEILDQRLQRSGSNSETQVLVQWSHTSPEEATWENFAELKSRFPATPAWGQAAVEGGRNVRLLDGLQYSAGK